MSATPLSAHVIRAGVMTGTNTLGPVVTILSRKDTVSYQVVWTGTPNGTFKIEASNAANSQDNATGPGTIGGSGGGLGGPAGPTLPAPPWVDITSACVDAVTGAALPAAAGAAGSFLVMLNLIDFRVGAIRISYTNVSGAGTLDVWLQMSEVGS